MPNASSPVPAAASSERSSVRRYRGPAGDELHVLVRPADTAASPAAQAASVWTALVRALHDAGAAPSHLVTETVFVDPRVGDVAPLLAERERAFADATDSGASTRPAAIASPALTVIGQAPLEQRGGEVAARLEVAAAAFVPRTGGDAARHVGAAAVQSASAVRGPRIDGANTAAFGIPTTRIVQVGPQRQLHAGGLLGRGDTPEAEAFDLFCQAEKLLAAAGMDFRDVIRTWIYLRDVDRDYAGLNRARREFFTSRGVDRRPASTGVQGIPFASGHEFQMALLAVKSPQPVDAALLSTPTLNEAWDYGADFARGLRLVDDNKVSLLVSGTASIDERGVSVHDNDVDAQVDRMVLNIETLLQGQGARVADLCSGVTYVKRAADAPAVLRRLAERGFGGFPLAVVEAPLCRPELLCETEAVALLPLPPKA